MKIVNMYKLITEGDVATEMEVATVAVNIERGTKLKEIKVVNGKIHFLFEEGGPVVGGAKK